MASELDMSLSGYAKIERGEVDITISKLYRIAEILNVELQQILEFQFSKIFNYKESNVQSHNEHSKMIIHSDAYLVKYVKILEQEVERLKKG
jgi:transcriptional regulator with XRE-family HTH domain